MLQPLRNARDGLISVIWGIFRPVLALNDAFWGMFFKPIPAIRCQNERIPTWALITHYDGSREALHMPTWLSSLRAKARRPVTDQG